MSERQLRQQIDRLAEQIDQLSVDSDKKTELQSLIDEIDSQLTAPEELHPDTQQELNDRLERSISRFEAEHPTVAGILRDIMYKLSSMGV